MAMGPMKRISSAILAAQATAIKYIGLLESPKPRKMELMMLYACLLYTSYLPDGTMLADYRAAHPEAAGTDCKKVEMFPVLTKFIDAKNNICLLYTSTLHMRGHFWHSITLT